MLKFSDLTRAFQVFVKKDTKTIPTSKLINVIELLNWNPTDDNFQVRF